jgi:hypothetical protein
MGTSGYTTISTSNPYSNSLIYYTNYPNYMVTDLLFLVKDGEIVERPLRVPTFNYCGFTYNTNTSK